MDCTTTSSPRKCRNCGHDQFDEDGDCAKCHEPASPPASKPNRSGSKSHIDVAAVKQSASGRWPDILERVAGIPAELLDGKNHPCPKCCGTDRFRMIDQEAGAVLCNQCFSQYNGDGIAAIRWMLGIDFAAAVRKLCDYLGMASGGNGKSSLNIVATYNYCDESGELMYQVCRLDPKDFRQRAPKPSGGWTWTTKGLRRIPYRLPELLAADKEQLVVVPEGEKDVDNCRQRGLVATCNAGGAGKWRPEYAEFFVGRKVCVIADRDEPGDKHGQQVAATLRGKATSVKVIEAPGDGKDVSDYFAAGGTVEELLAMAESAPEWQPTAAPPAGNTGGRERGAKKENQATVLVDMAIQDGCIPWHDADGIGYATIPVSVTVACHIEHWPLRSKAFRRWLCRQYYLTLKSSPNAQALQDALGVLDGIAQYEGKQHDTAVRVAEHEGNIYIDLCDAAWRAVEITPDGWSIVANPPVRFRRAKAMLPLPEPVRGGHVDELRGYVNVSDDEWPLVVAWLLASYRPTGPYPVLCLHGEQGSGKSTQARALRGVIDPNSAPLRSEPKEPRDMMIASSNGWIVSYDNLSRISAWLSDALCRLSSGGGFSTRELYSDAEETIFDAARPVILTGIEEWPRDQTSGPLIVVTLPTSRRACGGPSRDGRSTASAARILGPCGRGSRGHSGAATVRWIGDRVWPTSRCGPRQASRAWATGRRCHGRLRGQSRAGNDWLWSHRRGPAHHGHAGDRRGVDWHGQRATRRGGAAGGRADPPQQVVAGVGPGAVRRHQAAGPQSEGGWRRRRFFS